MIIDPNITLLLNRSGSVNLSVKRGNYWAPPTTLTARDNAIIKVEPRGWMTLTDTSTLYLKSGTKLIIDSLGRVYVECGSKVVAEDTAYSLSPETLSRIIYQKCYPDYVDSLNKEYEKNPDPNNPPPNPTPNKRPTNDTTIFDVTLCRESDGSLRELTLYAPDFVYIWMASWCITLPWDNEEGEITICLEQSPWELIYETDCHFQIRQGYIDIIEVIQNCFGLDLTGVDNFEVQLKIDKKNSGWEVDEVYIWNVTTQDVPSYLYDYFNSLSSGDMLALNLELSESGTSGTILVGGDLGYEGRVPLPEIPFGCEYTITFDIEGFIEPRPRIVNNELLFEVNREYCEWTRI